MQKLKEDICVEKKSKDSVVIALPETGEERSFITLRLPCGNKVELSYSSYYGDLEICAYEPAKTPEMDNFGGWDSRECGTTCWIDKKDIEGRYISSMHPAPVSDNLGADHIRKSTQVSIHVSQGEGGEL